MSQACTTCKGYGFVMEEKVHVNNNGDVETAIAQYPCPMQCDNGWLPEDHQ